MRVRSFVELFSAAKCLASRYRPVGRRLAVVTNGGGPGVLAADWASEIGPELGQPVGRDGGRAGAGLAPQASLRDLIDLGEEATPEHYRAAHQTADADAQIDGVLAIHAPRRHRRGRRRHRGGRGKAACANRCWPAGWAMPGVGTEAPGLNDASPQLPHARGGGGRLRQHRLLLPEPAAAAADAAADVHAGQTRHRRRAPAHRKRAGRAPQVLTELESKTLLSSFHIPVTQTMLARSATEAMMLATQLGFPVALKIDSPDITHKSDVQGVALNVRTAPRPRDTYADMVGARARLQPGERASTASRCSHMARRARAARSAW